MPARLIGLHDQREFVWNGDFTPQAPKYSQGRTGRL
jgi:hypothetical protein